MWLLSKMHRVLFWHCLIFCGELNPYNKFGIIFKTNASDIFPCDFIAAFQVELLQPVLFLKLIQHNLLIRNSKRPYHR